MGKLIFIVLIAIALIFKLRSNYKQNKETEEIMNFVSSQKHFSEEIYEIIEWEQYLRLEYVKSKLLFNRGEITNDDFIAVSKLLLAQHREIEQKYNVTEADMVKYYLDYKTIYSKYE